MRPKRQVKVQLQHKRDSDNALKIQIKSEGERGKRDEKTHTNKQTKRIRKRGVLNRAFPSEKREKSKQRSRKRIKET